MVLCNDARLVPYIDGNETRYDYEGEPTEAALLVLAEKLGPQCDSSAPPNIRVEYNRKYWSKLWIRFRTLEFDRERKSMSVICRSMVDDGIRIFVKGAPDTMLPRCSFISKGF
jgi:Ca2+ transporting ATPase